MAELRPDLPGINDFDFLVGYATIRNRRRNDQGGWDEFPARVTTTKHLDDSVLVDDFAADLPNGMVRKGLAIRAYDKSIQRWRYVWIDNRMLPDFTPLIGGFTNGVGEFVQVVSSEDFGWPDIPAGRTVHVKFVWDEITERSARWRQAYSLDAGETWDVNWVMEYSFQR